MKELFSTVLDMSLTGAVIIAAVMLIRLCMKRLPGRYSYMLWIIPAVRLICPVSFSSAFSLFNLLHLPTEDSLTEEYTPYIEITEDISAPVDTFEITATEIIAEVPADILPAAAESFDMGDFISYLLPWVWLAGVCAVLIYMAAQYIRTSRRIKNSKPLGGNAFTCESIDTPFVFGFAKTGIYIPCGVSEEDIKHILAHENAHIQRRDHIIKAAAAVIAAVHWFNPMVWLGFSAMTIDMELSCDERALKGYDVEERKKYAAALLNMSVRQNKLRPDGMLFFGESGIKTRIRSVLSMKKPKTVVCIIAAAVLTAAAVCLLTNAENIIADDSAGSYSVTEITPWSENEAKLDEEYAEKIISLINGSSADIIAKDKVPMPLDAEGGIIQNYAFRMYKGENHDGEYDSVTVINPCMYISEEYADAPRVIAVYRDNAPEPVHYRMPAEEYEALCSLLASPLDIFPSGHYTSTGDESWELSLIKENNELLFSFYYHGNNLLNVSPEEITASGLAVKSGDEWTGSVIKYMGGGRLDIEMGMASSLRIPGPFVRDSAFSEITSEEIVTDIPVADEIAIEETEPAENENGNYNNDDILDFCGSYLTEYYNALYDNKDFVNARYTHNSVFDTYLTMKLDFDRKTVVDRCKPEITIHTDERMTRGDTVYGRIWLTLPYEVKTGANSGFGRIAYFELEEIDGEYSLYYAIDGSPADSYAFYDIDKIVGAAPLELDVNSACIKLWEYINPDGGELLLRYNYVMPEYYYDGYGGLVRDIVKNKEVQISFSLPADWHMSSSTADLIDGGKIFEFGVPFSEEQGVLPEWFKTDYAFGREITVNEEKYGSDGDPYVYYIYTSYPDYYSDDGSYDAYQYVINSGGYYLSVHFVADSGLDRAVFEEILKSFEMKEAR